MNKIDPDFLRAKAALLGDGDYCFGCLDCGWVGPEPYPIFIKSASSDPPGGTLGYRCPGCKREGYWYKFALNEMNHDRSQS